MSRTTRHVHLALGEVASAPEVVDAVVGQIAAGALRLGNLMRFVSRSVVSGCWMFEWVATAETAFVTARAKGDAARTRAIAFWMRDAAMSSIAFVIFLVV